MIAQMKDSMFCSRNASSDFWHNQIKVVAVLPDDDYDDTAACLIYYYIGSKYHLNCYIVFNFNNIFRHVHSLRYILTEIYQNKYFFYKHYTLLYFA